ncbi:MAG: hypothetical protein IKQ59_07455 [Prevotella sp.]|nr:hypothetical protein [Prevotella sp.]
MNWSTYEDKLRVEFGSYLFTATNEGDSPAYAIATAADLSNLAAAVNAGNDGSGKTFRQTAKIYFDRTTENNYTPIGDYSNNEYHYFKGNYDGLGHTISGIRINNSDMWQGVFGWTDGADIRGITLADADITGNNQIGGIAGYNKGTVSDCHVAADVFIRAVQSNVNHHGGIVGQNDGTVSNCTSAATLTNSGGIYYGGIAGHNRGTLSHNLAIGAVVPTTSGNVNVTTQGPCQGIVAKGVLFDGGTLRVSADDAEAICSQTNIAILGGKLDATTTEDRHDGLYSFGGGTITLGWTRPDDYIHASRYLTNGDVKIANGQAFYYTFGNARTVLGPTNGALTADLIVYISGQTLQPICLLTESDGVTALTTAPWNSVADAPVAFIRNDNMGDLFSTVCLPFDFTAPEGCTFYVFQRVLYDENLRGEGKGAWVADFAEVSQMMAHTPYIFRNTAKKAVFTGTANTETDYDDALTSSVFSAQDANDQTWTFKGTYSAIDWSDADPSQPTYSMAYDQGIRSYYIGAFERIGQGASLAPFRACLTYSGNGNLPEEILVRFGNSHGDFTAIEGVLAE